jgi:hypothetical protein
MTSMDISFLFWVALFTFPFFYGSLIFQQKYAARILLGGLVASAFLLALVFCGLGYFSLVILTLGLMAVLGGLVGLIVKSIRLRLYPL